MEIIKNLAAVIGCILSLASLITLCTEKGRAWIRRIIVNNTQDLHSENKQQSYDITELKEKVDLMLLRFNGLEEVSKQQCRDTIKSIYYKYYHFKKIPLYERKTADYTHQIYTEIFNGNSYENLLYNEICKWEIDTISFQDIINEEP